ncbi:MAG TPA: exodeoxyribonuclease III [Steroidobacteraceae bacterium]|jgi:exodeoxyribonuclease-3
MKVYSWNVNGVRAVWKKGALQGLLGKHRPDILCLQEIKAERGQIEIDLPGYHKYWNSAVQKGYSGTAILCRQKPSAVINGFPKAFARRFRFADELQRDSAQEGRLITAEFPGFYVVTVYTPNAKDDLSRLALRHEHWDPAFLSYCRQLEKAKPVIFCGDLNVAHTELDLANPKSNRGRKGFTDQERRGFQNLVDAGFVDTFRLFRQGNGHYSWWSNFSNARARNVGWRIDYILVSACLRGAVRAADIHADVLGSDHCPVSITLDGLSQTLARQPSKGGTPISKYAQSGARMRKSA